VQDGDEAIRRARSQHEIKSKRGKKKKPAVESTSGRCYEWDSIFSACGGLSPHELESCPLDHSGIVAASDRNGAFQLNLYPAVPSRLCSLFRLNHTRRPSQKALVVRSRSLLGEIVLSNACSSGTSSRPPTRT
jgi:hypothetical protein